MIPSTAQNTKSSKSWAFGRMVSRRARWRQYRQPSRIPAMYASAYHRITRGPISRAIGSMLGNGIPVMEKVLSASVSGLRNGLTEQTPLRSEKHTSELQSLIRISYTVFCLKKKTQIPHNNTQPLH